MKVLIIGATSAIAQEVAKIYAKKTDDLVLVGRNAQSLQVIAQDLKVRGAAHVDILTQDLNDLSRHETLIDQAWSIAKKFDVVLFAHGILGNQDKAENDPQMFMEIINSNYLSHISLMNFVAKKMKEQKDGTIAVLSSVAGDRGKQSNFIYGSAHAGKIAYTDGLRNRLFPYGVHVINFKLGFVDTPMTKDFPKGPLWANPAHIASSAVAAIDKKCNTVYLPFFWRFIMLIIKNVPEFIFKKMKM